MRGYAGSLDLPLAGGGHRGGGGGHQKVIDLGQHRCWNMRDYAGSRDLPLAGGGRRGGSGGHQKVIYLRATPVSDYAGLCGIP